MDKFEIKRKAKWVALQIRRRVQRAEILTLTAEIGQAATARKLGLSRQRIWRIVKNG